MLVDAALAASAPNPSLSAILVPLEFLGLAENPARRFLSALCEGLLECSTIAAPRRSRPFMAQS